MREQILHKTDLLNSLPPEWPQDPFPEIQRRVQATGRKVASGDLRDSLRNAFLSQPRKTESDTGYLPTHETPDQRISREAARSAFDAYRPERAVYDNTERDHARRLAKVKVRLAQMERDSLIPAGEAKRILASGADPMTMLRKAAQVAKHVEHGTYESHAPTDAQAALSAQRSSRRGKTHGAEQPAQRDGAVPTVEMTLPAISPSFGATTGSRCRCRPMT